MIPTIVRAHVAHTPRNPFVSEDALEAFSDGAVAFADGRIVAVGAGTGLSMLKEGLAAYQVQMLSDSGVRLGPAELLWLATAAGALGLSGEVGDLGVGKSADFVLVRAPDGSTLDAVLSRAESMEQVLGAVFTLAREESITEVRVAERVV